MATSADLFAKDRSAILLDFRLERTCERNKVELSAHNRLPFMQWAWCVDWAIASHFDPKVAAELITRATPFLLADPNDFANTDPDFAHIRMLMVRANRDLEEDAAASAATAFALPIAHARIQESRNLMLRYFNARARLVHLLRDLASTSEFYGEAMLIAHACEYQAVSLRTFLHTLSVGICDAAAVSADGRGNPYVNAAWLTIFRAFYGAALRVPSLGPQAEQLVASALAISRVPSPALSSSVAVPLLEHFAGSVQRPVSGVGLLPPPLYATAALPSATIHVPALPPPAYPPPFLAPGPTYQVPISTPSSSNLSFGGGRGFRGRRQASTYGSVRSPLHVPSSPELVGDLPPYRQEPAPKGCFECGRDGHLAFECPARYLRLLHVPLPGFRPDCSRDPAAWNGSVPSAGTRDALLRYFRDYHPIPHQQAPIAFEVFERGIPPPLARRKWGGGGGGETHECSGPRAGSWPQAGARWAFTSIGVRVGGDGGDPASSCCCAFATCSLLASACGTSSSREQLAATLPAAS